MKIDVSHAARLANLPLKPEEKEKFEKQLSEILSYVEKLKEVDSPRSRLDSTKRVAGEAGTKNVETTSQVTGLENVTREDEAIPSLSQEEALSSIKSKYCLLYTSPSPRD